MVTYRSQDKELGDNTIDYSAVSNWNASKIGELRDRANGDYGNPGFVDGNSDERMSYIDKH